MECVNSEINLLKRDAMMNVYCRASIEVIADRLELATVCLELFVSSCESVSLLSPK